MQFKLIILILTLFIFPDSFAQKGAADSLQTVLKKHSEIDDQRVDLLNTIAGKISRTDPAKAIKLLKESEALAEKLQYNKGKMDCYLELGRLYNADEQYKTAIHYAAQGSIIAKDLKLTDYKRAFFLLLAEIHYDKNNSIYEKISAKDFQTEIKYKAFLKDSLHQSREKAGFLKKVIENQESELLISRLLIFLGIITFLGLILLGVYISTVIKSRKIKMENKQLLTEQKLRRSQMNPHFIFNSIQNIRSLINDKKEERAVDYLNRFSQLTRQILESSDENYTSLTEEVELIENYINLQQLLYNKSFNYTIKAEDAINTDSIFLPPMLTQPFIENAIKHGLNGKSANGLIEIKFYLKDRKLFFEISDNGCGFSNDKKATNHKSLATMITKERLAHYTKNRDVILQTQNILDLNKNIIGAKVIFEIPYIYEN